MELTVEEREKLILDYAFVEGCFVTKSLVAYLKNLGFEAGTSIENIRKSLQRLYQRKCLDYKELAADTKEKVFFLTAPGAKHIDKDFTLYHRRLKRINFRHIRHYFLVRSLEHSLLRDIQEYRGDFTNEFNDDNAKLQIPLGKDKILKPDAEIIISKGEFERLVLLVEIDTGTQSIVSTLKNKLDNYKKFFNSSRFNYKTFPIYILFLSPSSRIRNIIARLKNHSMMRYLLFIATEHIQSYNIDLQAPNPDKKMILDALRRELKKQKRASGNLIIDSLQTGRWLLRDENGIEYQVAHWKSRLVVQENVNLFTASVMAHSQGERISLSSLVKERELLLNFRNSIEIASKSRPDLEITVHTRYSTPDCYFPMMLEEMNNTLFLPDGCLTMSMKFNGTQRVVFFALILVLPDSLDSLTLLNIFFEKRYYSKMVTELPIAAGGILVIAANEAQIETLRKVLRKFEHLKKNRLRVIMASDCSPEKIFEPVWRGVDEDMGRLALLGKKGNLYLDSEYSESR